MPLLRIYWHLMQVGPYRGLTNRMVYGGVVDFLS